MSEDSFKFLEGIFEDKSSPNAKPNAHQTDDDERGFCTFAEAIIHIIIIILSSFPDYLSPWIKLHDTPNNASWASVFFGTYISGGG